MRRYSSTRKYCHLSQSSCRLTVAKPQSQWVIICEIGNVGNFGDLSGSFCHFCCFYSSLIYPFIVLNVQDAVRSRHQCNRMVSLYTQIALETHQVLLLYLNTKQNTCLLVEICCLSFPKFIHKCSYSYTSYTNVNVTVHNK